MQAVLILYGLVGLLVLRLVVSIYSILTSPLRNIPGPLAARFTRLWYFSSIRSQNFEKANINLHQKHGPIVRIAPNMYSIATPDKTVYSIGSKFIKSDWYNGFTPPRFAGNLFTERNPKLHAEGRKKVQSLYSMSSLVTYEAYVDKCTKIFSKRLTEFADNDAVFDLGHWFICYAFDVIGEITYSNRFGFLDAGSDVDGMLNALQSSLVYGVLVGIVAWVHPYAYEIMQYLPNTGAHGKQSLVSRVNRTIAEREQERAQKVKSGRESLVTDDEELARPKDFLDKISDARDENPEKVSALDVFQLNMSNIVAGSDTTGVSLSAIFYYLLREPATMQKLRNEIDEAIADGRADENNIRFAQSQQLPYLQAVLKEGLRMHAAVGLPLWRDVPKGGAEICGQFFPEGTTVGVNPWVLHYNTDVYGPDASVFRPERWIEAEKEGGERLKKMDSFYTPFGLGSRTCIGRHISILEMSKVVPQLIKNFDFELDNSGEHWKTSNYWFVKPVNFKVKVKRRVKTQ